MYLYNITINIGWADHEQWLIWMKEVYLPFMKSTNLIAKHLLLRLKDIDQTDGPTYALQVFIETEAFYNKFAEEHLSKVNQMQKAHWGNNMLSFATLMEVVH